MEDDTGSKDVPPPLVPIQLVPAGSIPMYFKRTLHSSLCFYRHSQRTEPCISSQRKLKARTSCFATVFAISPWNCALSGMNKNSVPAIPPFLTLTSSSNLQWQCRGPWALALLLWNTGCWGCRLMLHSIHLQSQAVKAAVNVPKELKCKVTEVLALLLWYEQLSFSLLLPDLLDISSHTIFSFFSPV